MVPPDEEPPLLPKGELPVPVPDEEPKPPEGEPKPPEDEPKPPDEDPKPPLDEPKPVPDPLLLPEPPAIGLAPGTLLLPEAIICSWSGS